MLTTTKKWCWSAVVLFAFVIALPAQAQRNVTLTLNTATLPDTLDALDEVQVRGAIDGTGNVTLPDGNVIDWNDNTTLKPTNDGGDFWSVGFQIPDNSELKFKFYAQLAEDDGIGGWEDGGDHVVEAGTGDVTLPLHFFEKGDDKEYDWRPFESKTDTVGVWFRVYMCTSEGQGDGYNPNAPLTVAVRGDDFSGTGPLSWGDNNVVLAQESTTDGQPGYDLWSGVAYYPTSMAGMTQNFKYVFVKDDVVSWEDGTGDRPFTIPQGDSTLAWVYYGNTAPVEGGCGATPVTGDVIFTVDLTPLEQVGLFNKARGDTIQVMGSFNGWDWGDRVEPEGVLDPIPGQLLYERVQTLSLVVPAEPAYKYILWFDSTGFHDELGFAPPGRIQNQGSADEYFAPLVFEEPLSTAGGNRTFEYTGATELELPVDLFNDILEYNIIPDGTSIDVTWTVDMTPALTPEIGGSNAGDAFEPATDKVMLQADGDLIWAVTQGYPRREDGTLYQADTTFTFAATSGNVYQGTKTVSGPTYGAMQYFFGYGASQASGAAFFETEGGFQTGRRRTRFIPRNPDGSWPESYSFPAETFIADGDKPVEQNPALATAVEPVDGELPQQITLSQNFPNPFNPTTTFEYTISAAQQVDLFVYDIIGRRVATLVSGLQPANTYKVTFDASTLASGTYFYRLETADKVITRSMVLLK
ncbi:MAG: T9SS type A sorting domain-containing protein [Rhodothermales bacterium]|nr:T9SS type A sorting domain-containing protein [Rhodothermales bacterium]